MKTVLLLNRIRKLKAFFFLLLALLALGSSVSHGFWNFGSKRFINHNNATPLEKKAGSGSLSEFGFVNSVGGVALTATAKPDPTLSFNNISLDYNPALPDGSRMVVKIDGNTLVHTLPDWMLAPIARFADSEFNAAVSLFGPDTGPCPSGFNGYIYHIVYHPALRNTLLGLRILHSDVLFSYLSEFWQVPGWEEPQGATPITVTAPSEEIPTTPNYWIAPHNKIVQTFIDSQNAGEDFTSWVLNDIDQPVTFNAVQNKLVLTGRPYYYFWKGIPAIPEPLVVEVPQLTAGMRNHMADQGAIKELVPFVYNAVIQTTRYAAFFRYIKAHYPATWNSFLNKIANVQLSPDILTPENWASCIIGASDIHKNKIVRVKSYPNPAIDRVNIEIPEGIKNDFYIRLFDANGKLALEEHQSAAGIQKTFSLDIGTLPAGTYLIEISDGSRVASGQIVKR